MRFIRLLQLPSSPDFAKCGFFLFGYLNAKFEGSNFSQENDVIFAVRQILTQISVETLAAVMDDCVCCLNKYTELDGDYVQ
jgi:hypothetical protein